MSDTRLPDHQTYLNKSWTLRRTPGPWHHSASSNDIVTLQTERSVASPPDGYDQAQWDADAALIAAAPNLLNVAREIEQLVTSESDDLGFHVRVVSMSTYAVERLRYAIALAEGRTR